MSVYRLRGQVRHYPWGGQAFLPELLGQPADGRPWAEFWLGAHPGDPAEIEIDGGWRPLDQVIAADPGRWLGPAVAGTFGQLPYLMKVLDVARPLSIQVHPNRGQAAAGFASEEAAGIARDAPQRNFKDSNPKPELALALSEFWLLYGFRPAAQAACELDRFESLAPLASRIRTDGLEAAFRQLMTAGRDELSRWLVPVFASLQDRYPKSRPEYWIALWRSQFDSHEAAVDRGVPGFLLMNLVRLNPGQRVFQAANALHAYLGGQCVEIMANSDNVIRGGLTAKHVDPDALASHVRFEPGAATGDVPADLAEFRLDDRVLGAGQSLTLPGQGLSIVLLLDGELVLEDQRELRRGEAAAVAHGSVARGHSPAGARLAIAQTPNGPVGNRPQARARSCEADA